MSILKKIKSFYRIEKAESTRITWPSKKELISHTILILVVSLILAIIFALADWGFGELLKLLIKVL